MKTKATIAVFVTGVLWGIISIFVKGLAAAGLTLMQTVLIRSIFSSASLAIVLLFRDRNAFRIHLRDIPLFIGTGIISLVIFNRCYMYTMTHDNAAVGSVLLYTSPIFIMLFSAVLFRERITVRKILALILTFSGCLLVSGVLSGNHRIPTGVLVFGLLSGFFYSLYTIFGKFALQKYSSATVSLYTFLFAILGALPFSDLPSFGKVIAFSPSVLLWGLGIGTISTAIPYFLYTWGLSHMDSGKAAIVVAIEPIVATCLGILIYKEDSNLSKIIGILLVLVAILTLNLPAKSDKKEIQK